MESSSAEDLVPDHCRRCPGVVTHYDSEMGNCPWPYAFYLRRGGQLQDVVREESDLSCFLAVNPGHP